MASDFFLSTNMNLPIPTVGQSPGPSYASDINAALTLVDSHNHSAGQGVQINPSGININSDLPFNGNNLITARSIRFSAQASPLSNASDLGCLYESGVDLYYNDGNGNQVRITQSGGVAGSPGSIANLTSPASATYVSANETFVWQSAASTPANLDAGSVIFRNVTANSNGITLSAPNSLASNYALILPAALPPAQQFVTLDNSGNISAPWTVDNASLEVSSNVLQVKPLGITNPLLAALNYNQSASSGAFATSSSSFVAVTNLSSTITTSGRPVWVGLVPDGSTTNASYIGNTGSSTNTQASFRFKRDGTIIAASTILLQASGSTTPFIKIPAGAWSAFDVVSAGSHTYTFEVILNIGTALQVEFLTLLAYEL